MRGVDASFRSLARGAPSSGWRSVSQLEAKLTDARLSLSALESENKLLRSEADRKRRRITQLEDTVSSLEYDLKALDAKVRAGLDALLFRVGQPLSVESATQLDEAVEDAREQASEDSLASNDEWSAADWIASLGACKLIEKHLRARDESAHTERCFLHQLSARDSHRTIYELLGNSGLLEQTASMILEGARQLEAVPMRERTAPRTPAMMDPVERRANTGYATKLFCHATERKLDFLTGSYFRLQSITHHGAVLQLVVNPVDDADFAMGADHMSSSLHARAEQEHEVHHINHKYVDEGRRGRSPPPQSKASPCRPTPATTIPAPNRRLGCGDWLARTEPQSNQGVPWCATWAAEGGCYFWYYLPHVSGKHVDARYRLRGTAQWRSHQPATVQIVPGDWWRTPAWHSPQDSSFEQGCWVDGQCVIAGIIGPAHIQPMLPDGTAPPCPQIYPKRFSFESSSSPEARAERVRAGRQNGQHSPTQKSVDSEGGVPTSAGVQHESALKHSWASAQEGFPSSEDLMVRGGLRYVRIWALLEPDRGRFG
ncbi:MAG: hypothetical protein SGPRY_004254, partial [Prymnesium sp.]